MLLYISGNGVADPDSRKESVMYIKPETKAEIVERLTDADFVDGYTLTTDERAILGNFLVDMMGLEPLGDWIPASKDIKFYCRKLAELIADKPL